MPLIRVITISIAACVISATFSALNSVSTSAITTSRATLTTSGKASRMPPASVNKMSLAVVSIKSRLFSKPVPNAETIEPPSSSTAGNCPKTASSACGISSPIKSDILPISPSASNTPLVNSASKSTPSPARLLSTGNRIVPSAFFAAFAPPSRRCIVSSNSAKSSSTSDDKTAPAPFASSAYCLNVSVPASINGFKSVADLPKRVMAILSRSASFSIFPNASTTSKNTSSLSRKLPFASVTDTPSAAYASAAAPVPSFASAIDLTVFLRDPAIVLTSTSNSSDA